jgi:hypothetical protein
MTPDRLLLDITTAQLALERVRAGLEGTSTPISLTPVRDLIDAARAITGSDAATARRLGVARSAVTKWKAGENALPKERRGQLDAIIAGGSDAR